MIVNYLDGDRRLGDQAFDKCIGPALDVDLGCVVQFGTDYRADIDVRLALRDRRRNASDLRGDLIIRPSLGDSPAFFVCDGAKVSQLGFFS